MGIGGTSIAVHAVRLFDKAVACGSLDEGSADAGANLAKLNYVYVVKVVVLEDYFEDWARAEDTGLTSNYHRP